MAFRNKAMIYYNFWELKLWFLFDSRVCFCCLNYVHCVSSIELLYAALLIWLQLGAIVETLWRGLSENLKRASAWSIVAHYSYKNSCRSYQPNKWVTPFWGKSISLFAPIPIRLDINRDNTSRSQSRLSDGQVFPDTQNRSNLPHFWSRFHIFEVFNRPLFLLVPKLWGKIWFIKPMRWSEAICQVYDREKPLSKCWPVPAVIYQFVFSAFCRRFRRPKKSKPGNLSMEATIQHEFLFH